MIDPFLKLNVLYKNVQYKRIDLLGE